MSPQGGEFYSPHFAGGETEAQYRKGLGQGHTAELGESRLSLPHDSLCHSPCRFSGSALQTSQEDASPLRHAPPASVTGSLLSGWLLSIPDQSPEFCRLL